MSAILTSDPAATPGEPPTSLPSGPEGWRWRNALADLGNRFFTEQSAQAVPAPYWVTTSESCARWLGLPPGWENDPSLRALDVLSGHTTWPGMRPLSTVYSGHQFGVWAGQLGDGRALWLGEVETPNGPVELQLKGAGRTPYSRGGDGRAVLRSSIREFLCSEAMHALGVPTTRALALIGTDLRVRRETIETGAVVTRAAESFIRFGHFEHFTHTAPGSDDTAYAALRQLADFVIDHYYPEARQADKPACAMLKSVAERTADLMAAWQSVGFSHGVMNTDNMSILGLTIDYGPFGFMDAFDPGFICNHTDEQGRYAYARQPDVGYWNLLALGQALLPLEADTDVVLAAIDAYKPRYASSLRQRMRAKFGLATREDGDPGLIEGLLSLMAKDHADFSITFRRLGDFSTAESARNDALRDLFLDREAFDAWAATYRERLLREGSVDAERLLRMNAVNPKFVLRNYLAETAIERAQQGDFSEVKRLQAILEKPFDEQPEHAAYADFPPAWAQHIEVSCSS